MINPVLGEAPCLRCGQAVTWRRDKRGCPYSYCHADAGGCGAKVTLGRNDPFPDPVAAAPAPEPAPDPEPAPAPEPAPVPDLEPESEPKRERDPFLFWDQ